MNTKTLERLCIDADRWERNDTLAGSEIIIWHNGFKTTYVETLNGWAVSEEEVAVDVQREEVSTPPQMSYGLGMADNVYGAHAEDTEAYASAYARAQRMTATEIRQAREQALQQAQERAINQGIAEWRRFFSRRDFLDATRPEPEPTPEPEPEPTPEPIDLSIRSTMKRRILLPQAT